MTFWLKRIWMWLFVCLYIQAEKRFDSSLYFSYIFLSLRTDQGKKIFQSRWRGLSKYFHLITGKVPGTSCTLNSHIINAHVPFHWLWTAKRIVNSASVDRLLAHSNYCKCKISYVSTVVIMVCFSVKPIDGTVAFVKLKLQMCRWFTRYLKALIYFRKSTRISPKCSFAQSIQVHFAIDLQVYTPVILNVYKAINCAQLHQVDTGYAVQTHF